jgi:hypothetical protein
MIPGLSRPVTDPHRPVTVKAVCVTTDEHTHLAFLDPTGVPDDELPRPYRHLIALR